MMNKLIERIDAAIEKYVEPANRCGCVLTENGNYIWGLDLREGEGLHVSRIAANPTAVIYMAPSEQELKEARGTELFRQVAVYCQAAEVPFRPQFAA